jgi:hypothetical protein
MFPALSDNNDAFLDWLPAARGLYGAGAEPRNVPDINFGGMGGLGGYFNNPLAVMGIQTGLNWAFGQTGLMPGPGLGRNLYDQYQDKAYWAARRTALTQASEADRATYVQMMRGIASMRGTPWGLEQQRAANVISGDVALMAPVLAQMMPEVFDALHGTRGSATVLAQFLHRGGRAAVDPITGPAGRAARSSSAAPWRNAPRSSPGCARGPRRPSPGSPATSAPRTSPDRSSSCCAAGTRRLPSWRRCAGRTPSCSASSSSRRARRAR